MYVLIKEISSSRYFSKVIKFSYVIKIRKSVNVRAAYFVIFDWQVIYYVDILGLIKIDFYFYLLFTVLFVNKVKKINGITVMFFNENVSLK